MKKAPFRLFSFSALICGYGFLYVPIFCVIFYSFNSSKNITIWQGFSLQWYTSLLENQQLIQGFITSLKIGVCAASFATIIGTLCAVILAKTHGFKGKKVLQILVISPLIIPEVILGLAFLLYFNWIYDVSGLFGGRGIFSITIAHSTIAMAYVTLLIRSQLLNQEEALYEAALDLGAPPIKVFFKITLPIIFPSLVSGWLLAFILSFDDVVIASFIAGPETTTLPMVVFSSIRYGLTPEVNALATLMIATVTLLVGMFGVRYFKNSLKEVK